MARLVSLFLCGDVSEVKSILPIIRRIVSGDGLDVVKTKELLRKKLSIYEDWAPEIDRAVRWAEGKKKLVFIKLSLGPFSLTLQSILLL